MRIVQGRTNLAEGTQFFKLTTIGPCFYALGSDHVHAHVVCRCDCGQITCVRVHRLFLGATKSCGCSNRRNLKHGRSSSRGRKNSLYTRWGSMIHRCYNQKRKDWKDYGGRGITVCDEWRNDFIAFENWALANGYQTHLTIDRKDNDGNYEPSNCHWATHKQQSKNRRGQKL